MVVSFFFYLPDSGNDGLHLDELTYSILGDPAMKNVLKTMTLLALALMIAMPVAAQEKKKKKGKKRAGNPLAAVVKRVKDAGADGATVDKVEALAKEYGPKLAEARKGLGDAAKKMNEARKAAAADGKKGKELQAVVQAAVKLTDEQKAAQKSAQELQRKFNAAVVALLTPEQVKAAGIRGGRGAGKNKKKKKKAE